MTAEIECRTAEARAALHSLRDLGYRITIAPGGAGVRLDLRASHDEALGGTYEPVRRTTAFLAASGRVRFDIDADDLRALLDVAEDELRWSGANSLRAAVVRAVRVAHAALERAGGKP